MAVDPNISLTDNLLKAGFGHRPHGGNGKRMIFRLATGEEVGPMDCFEASDWLEENDWLREFEGADAMSARLHLHVPTTAEIAETHAHRVVAAGELVAALEFVLNDDLSDLAEDTRCMVTKAIASAEQSNPPPRSTCATTRAALAALLAACTDRSATEPDWHAAIAGARAALTGAAP